MIALLQRVTEAQVKVGGAVVAAIDQGLLVFIGVQRTDDAESTERMLERILGYRMFADDAGRMNRSIRDIDGGLLLVPQFTLAADTRKGTRASFTSAADAAAGRQWFDFLVERAGRVHRKLAVGQFGADMQVHLVNDGPVTFWLEAGAGN